MGAFRLSPFDDSWVRQEMWISDEAKAAFQARRSGSGPKALSPFERLASGHRQAKRKRAINFKIRLRLWEIEKIIEWRHDGQVPETDDGDLYIQAIAYSLNALDRADFDEVLHKWCQRFAPWALARAGDIIRPIINNLFRRKHDLHPDEVARLLCLGMAERTQLGIKTIGASDMTTAERKRWARARKQARDRQRIANRRRRLGKQARAEWLDSTIAHSKPWEAEGISRRTWYRRRGTGPSRIDISPTCDTPVPNPGATSGKQAGPLVGVPSRAFSLGTGNADAETEPRSALHELHVMRPATEGGQDAA